MLVQNRHGSDCVTETQTRTTHAHNDSEPLRANVNPRPVGNATIVVVKRGERGGRLGLETQAQSSNDAAAAEL